MNPTINHSKLCFKRFWLCNKLLYKRKTAYLCQYLPPFLKHYLNKPIPQMLNTLCQYYDLVNHDVLMTGRFSLIFSWLWLARVLVQVFDRSGVCFEACSFTQAEPKWRKYTWCVLSNQPKMILMSTTQLERCQTSHFVNGTARFLAAYKTGLRVLRGPRERVVSVEEKESPRHRYWSLQFSWGQV